MFESQDRSGESGGPVQNATDKRYVLFIYLYIWVCGSTLCMVGDSWKGEGRKGGCLEGVGKKKILNCIEDWANSTFHHRVGLM